MGVDFGDDGEYGSTNTRGAIRELISTSLAWVREAREEGCLDYSHLESMES